MTDINTKALQALFDHNLEPINTRLASIEETLNSHTAILDALVKNTQNWDVGMKIMKAKLERYER
jgi:hypothetical protein